MTRSTSQYCANRSNADHNDISRRRFLDRAVTLGGLAAVASWLQACAPAEWQTPSPQAAKPASSPAVLPTPTRSPDEMVAGGQDVAQVAFVKTRDRREGVQRALDLVGVNPVQNKQVLLKPNLNSADPTPGSTHPEVLRSLVQRLWQMGASTITVVDRSGMGNTRQTMERTGVFSLAQELDFDTIVFDELTASDWVMLDAADSHWRQGFPFPRCCLEADAIVQTCCLKTHRFGGHFTISLKNSVGLVAQSVPGEGYNYMRELHSSDHQRRMIAEINTAYTPALVVVDGVEAFVNGGPDSGERVWSEVVLAGTDRVALDAVGVAILRHFGTTPQVSTGPIFAQEQIARAVELGLGVDGPAKIRLVTGDEDSQAYAAQIEAILMQG